MKWRDFGLGVMVALFVLTFYNYIDMAARDYLTAQGIVNPYQQGAIILIALALAIVGITGGGKVVMDAIAE